jgi:hypothetical protein
MSMEHEDHAGAKGTNSTTSMLAMTGGFGSEVDETSKGIRVVKTKDIVVTKSFQYSPLHQ